ncbi:hypothetical protein [Prevotella sp.]|uniref:hypothetical protein n=1 Tax=Prevotella sp. TaxID=59823 RepID=UPI0027E2D825|nr:hypothetical protein [Prevotella sp.]
MKELTNLLKILCAILIMLAILFISVAIYKGCQEVPQNNTKMQVYINENDSLVNQLQKDVTQLTKLLKDMQNDSMVITIDNVKRKECE